MFRSFLLLAAAFIGSSAPAAAQRLGIWEVVHDKCVAAEKTSGSPRPCEVVSISGGEDHGYAVLKDRRGDSQFLLIPTERVNGIDDPLVLASDAPNYFAAAWEHIGLVSVGARAPLPRDSLSVAINSVASRSQDQLHIHLECIRPDVKATLRRLDASIGTLWSPLKEEIDGRRYRAMRIAAENLSKDNPFRLLADGVPGAVNEMGMHTLVAVGTVDSDGKPGFILLDGHTDLASGDRGKGELLQDHDCAVAVR